MRAIIFGANGQDGYYLNELCKRKGIEAIGVSRSGHWIHGDVSSYEQVDQVVQHYRPDYIFHIAANSTTRHDALFENHETISTGTLNILESVRVHCRLARVFITGSGVQFKNIGKPISEDDPFEASSVYSIARIQSVYAARYYRSLGVRVYVGYLFHHESPLRKHQHTSQMIAMAARRVAAGSTEVFEIGDISVEKEWTFAGDVVRGIFTLVQQDEVFEAIIGSGNAYSIKDWLDKCFGIINKNWPDHVRFLERFSPEYERLVSNPKRMHSLGWFPTVTLSELARMMVLS
jgi:GDPmannose 4,6-dehydratase